MSLVACSVCRQPFYASCHDSSCIDATCPYCEYEDDDWRGEPAEASSVGPAVLASRGEQRRPTPPARGRGA